ncbi:unnamed protein product [Ceratitis capitata]|uniref:(Mediterranean fruit fly) hypothetical protein n=1 Tax=Ceratitis capitata TaxID=7213 RepID=A0A811TXM8_CERCA|nr:unnamed protein product [Ceratitis capitata]
MIHYESRGPIVTKSSSEVSVLLPKWFSRCSRKFRKGSSNDGAVVNISARIPPGFKDGNVMVVATKNTRIVAAASRIGELYLDAKLWAEGRVPVTPSEPEPNYEALITYQEVEDH